MHVLFKEGYADRAYLAKYADAPDELEAHLAIAHARSGRKGSPGCPPGEIVEFARLYGQTKRSFIRVGYGFSRLRNGSVNVHAVTCLPTVTGAWQYRGGGALYSNGGLYKINDRLIKGLDALDPSIRILDQSPHRRRADRRQARPRRRAAGDRPVHPEHQSDERVPRPDEGARGLPARRSASSACMSSS